MSKHQYLEDCIAESCDEHGITITPEQLKSLAADMEAIWDGYSQHSYQPENPLISENEQLRARLRKEQDKRGCPDCGGRGRLKYNSGPWAVDTQCDTCHGEGKV